MSSAQEGPRGLSRRQVLAGGAALAAGAGAGSDARAKQREARPIRWIGHI